MDAASIDQAVLLGWYWEHQATCNWHNQIIAEWRKQSPERFIGFASIQPAGDPDEVLRQLEEAANLGMQGVGELHPGVQGFNPSSPGWQILAQWCSQRNWPINFHASKVSGHDHPSSVPTPPANFIQMASDFPELKIILSHWGGGLASIPEYVEALSGLTNIYFDCAAVPLLYGPESFRQMIDQVGIDRLLYGSDYPLRLFPQQQRSADFNSYLDYIRESADLSEDELTALFSKNFTRLIRP